MSAQRAGQTECMNRIATPGRGRNRAQPGPGTIPALDEARRPRWRRSVEVRTQGRRMRAETMAGRLLGSALALAVKFMLGVS